MKSVREVVLLWVVAACIQAACMHRLLVGVVVFQSGCLAKRPPPDAETALDRDRFMSPQQALEFGLIDEIVTSRKQLPKADASS